MNPATQGSDFYSFQSLDRNNLLSTLALNQFQSLLQRLGIRRRKKLWESYMADIHLCHTHLIGTVEVNLPFY